MTTHTAARAAGHATGAAIQAASARVARRRGAGASSVGTAQVRTWTGRAALSRATSTGVPHLVTSGTHRTRVSEMRAGGAAAPPASAPARRALARRAPETPGRG